MPSGDAGQLGQHSLDYRFAMLGLMDDRDARIKDSGGHIPESILFCSTWASDSDQGRSTACDIAVSM
jgi:hypothetical protein